MTIPRVNKILEKWGSVPPIHLSMAAMAGVDLDDAGIKNGAGSKAATPETEKNMAMLMQNFPQRATSVG
jgi:hypothetical protein